MKLKTDGIMRTTTEFMAVNEQGKLFRVIRNVSLAIALFNVFDPVLGLLDFRSGSSLAEK